MLGRARCEDKEEIATNLPPLRSPRRKNKTWKVQWVCVSKSELKGQNLHSSTAVFRERVFSPTSSGQNRWQPGHLCWFEGREWGIPYVCMEKHRVKKWIPHTKKWIPHPTSVRPSNYVYIRLLKKVTMDSVVDVYPPATEILPVYRGVQLIGGNLTPFP